MKKYLCNSFNNGNKKYKNMKYQKLIAVAGIISALAGCTSINNGGGYSQAYVDSAVNHRVDSTSKMLTMKNDSLINAEAMMKADSMMMASKNPMTPSTTAMRSTRPETHHIKNTTPDNTKVTTRPGADNGTNKPVTTRPGADNGTNKPVTDRPGATK